MTILNRAVSPRRGHHVTGGNNVCCHHQSHAGSPAKDVCSLVHDDDFPFTFIEH